MNLAVDEARIQTIGRQLLEGVHDGRPRVGSLAWLDESGMAWSMNDPRLKAALFRFVDALPNLSDSRTVVSHLQEYLGPVASALPWPLRSLLGVQAWPIRSLASASARLGALRLARRFIAGETPQQAERSVLALRRKHWAFTIDLLGEAVLSETEAENYARAYHQLLDHLGPAAKDWTADALVDGPATDPTPRVNLSLKLSALTSRWDPIDPQGTSRRVAARLRPILQRARELGAFVNIDMEHHAYKDLTLEIMRSVLSEDAFRDWPDVGIAMQAYLRSGLGDLRDLAQWSAKRGVPIWVRLVKGAYWDYETVIASQYGWPVPVFTDKAATDANFEACTRFLFTHHRQLRPAIAGHNARSIAHAIACAEAAQMAPGSYEFQMLYGMVDPLKQAVCGLGQRVRVYAPFGDLLPGMAYLVRRLLENTANTSFVRAGFLSKASADELLKAPLAEPLKQEEEPESPATGGASFANEALRDFSQAAQRDAWDAALQTVRASLPRRICPVINGRSLNTDLPWTWHNPSRLSEVVSQGCFADVAVAQQAIAGATAAWPAWRGQGVEVRAQLAEALADHLASERDQFAALVLLEVGKNRREADAEVAEAIDFCRYYAQQARELYAAQRRDVAGELNEQVLTPRGLAVIIAPWNFPLAILCGMAVANLVVGNPVLLKPAEQATAIGQALHSAMLHVGFPPAVCQFIPGIGETLGPLLSADPRVAVIAFTGSRAVGMQLAMDALRLASSKGEVTKVVAEMGGKNAIIVDADADLDEAVLGVLQSAFSFQGQKCSACSRVIVLDAVHDRFVERLAAAVQSLSAGPADDPGAVIGPLIDDDALARLQAAAEEVLPPLRLAAEGPTASGGHFVPPRVVVGVPPEHRLAQEELFGPLLAVIRAADLDEALRIANATPYALTGGCFSRSPATLERMRREFMVGNLYLNRTITGALVDRQPFGGFRLSGLGTKAGGPDYLRQFVHTRTLSENTLRHGFAVDRTGLSGS